MGLDLFQSRRNYNQLCKWWSRDERDEFESDELVHKRVPSGSFWAKEVNAEELKNNVINGSVMFDSSRVTIKSPDNCEGLKNNDLVEYQGCLWRVDNVQKKKARIQNSEFAADSVVSHYWYLNLVK